MDVVEGITGVPVWILMGLCVYACVLRNFFFFGGEKFHRCSDISLKADLFISAVQSPRHVYMNRGERSSC